MPPTLLEGILARLQRGDAPADKWPDVRGEYWALCPYHPDTHIGSFSVSERGFKCFACGAQGSLRALARKLEIRAYNGAQISPPTAVARWEQPGVAAPNRVLRGRIGPPRVGRPARAGL